MSSYPVREDQNKKKEKEEKKPNNQCGMIKTNNYQLLELQKEKRDIHRVESLLKK